MRRQADRSTDDRSSFWRADSFLLLSLLCVASLWRIRCASCLKQNGCCDMAAMMADFGAGWTTAEEDDDDELRRLRRRRRRLMVLLAAALSETAYHEHRRMKLLDLSLIRLHVAMKRRAPKTRRLTVPPDGQLREFVTLTEEGFRRRYRMTQPQFTELLHLCEATDIWRTDVASVSSKRTHIPTRLWLAMVLDQLSQGLTGRAVSHKHGVNEGLYSRKRQGVLESIVCALNSPDSPATHIQWPDKDDAEAWKRLAAEFVPSLDARCAAFYGTVAAGDGTLIPIRLVGVSDAYRESFRSRKVGR